MNVEKYIANPKKYLESRTIPQIVEFLEKANYMYRNTSETLVNDDLYDYAENYLREKEPKHPFITQIGAPVERKVKLPIWMGSQDKIRDDPKTLERWMKKYAAPYILTDKLDGNSGLFVFDKKKQITLYTRGDGKYGQNVTAVLNYITPARGWEIDMPTMVRGEFIISRKNWEKIKHLGANARNVAAGILNSKTINPVTAKYLDFVAYELLEPQLEFQEGLEYMKGLGFKVVEYDVLDSAQTTNDRLSEYLMKRRRESPYEIDGIVVRDNEYHPIVSGKNPQYSFAFKTILTHEEAEVMVTQVEWNVSKDGLLKPLVHFNAVHIGGVKIQKATGFNGAFIQQHTIGPGARIIVIRSGDVIPHIMRVLSVAANGKPSMPEISYEWNETGVDIRIRAEDENDQMKLRQLEHFVKTLDIQFIGSGILKKLYDVGVKTIPQLVALQKEDLLLVEGIQEKGAEKISKSLSERMKTVSCEELMVASNLFGRGFGLKKIQLIVSENPGILRNELLTELKVIKGIGETTVKQFLAELPVFYQFLKALGITKCKQSREPVIEENMFDGKSIIFTGFRNKDWEKKIESLGGKIASGVSKNTFLVVAASEDDPSLKVTKGKELGILITKDDFARKYGF